MNISRFSVDSSCFQIQPPSINPMCYHPSFYSMSNLQSYYYNFFIQSLKFKHSLIHQKYEKQFFQKLHIANDIQNAKIKLQQTIGKQFSEGIQNIQYADIRKKQKTRDKSSSITNKIKKPKYKKNQTKNIPKNYGKAIIMFIENNRQIVRQVLYKFSAVSQKTFLNIIRSKKNRINSIFELRSFWVEDQYENLSKVIRILSNIFLRRYGLEYIFNSRVINYSEHIKYRNRLLQAIKNPNQFTNIKQY